MTKPKFCSSGLQHARIVLFTLLLGFGIEHHALAQSSVAGTIDPNTVTATKTVDFTLGEDRTSNNNISRQYAIDAAGNYYLASIVYNSASNAVGPGDSVPVISKFSHDGRCSGESSE